ncbi:MAG: hypothetical protein OEX97_00950 [Acidimicrobiia bacterium]|nr:hypothetical protein [Acidimicrobiia bacterium]
MNTDHLALPESSRKRIEPSGAARRFGFVIAAAINGALLFAVNNVLTWDVLPFLTEEFEDVVPLITLSLAAAIVANLIYVVFDPKWFKSLTQIGLAGISMAATVRLYRVFPFDFSAYDFGWEPIARGILIIAIVGIAISVVAEAVKLSGSLKRLVDSARPTP